MTREEFISILDEKGYSYEIVGDKIVVLKRGYVHLESLTSLPPDVGFRNGGSVNLRALTSLPPDVKFENGADVHLESLTSLPPGVEFRNGGEVWLRDLIGGWFNEWKGNIKGIDSKRLLNKMIKQGVFER